MDTSWINFYSAFADALRNYETKQEELLRLIKEIYQELNIRLPKLCYDGQVLKNIDPFSVYGLFNKGITNENRIKIIRKFAEKLNIDTNMHPIPTSFEGVPVYYNTSATLYEFDEKLFEPTSKSLWGLFNAAIDLADNQDGNSQARFEKFYEECTKLRYVKYKLSMGLFWCRPNFYLNLDGKNRWFISERSLFSEDVKKYISKLKKMPSAKEYLQLSNNIKDQLLSLNLEYKTLPELSHESFVIAEKVNKEIKESKKKPDQAIPEGETSSKRYWLYSPGKSAVNWEQNLDGGVMSIGGGYLGAFSNYSSQEEIQNQIKKTKYAETDTTPSVTALTYWQFYNDIKKGDVIFVRKGLYKIIGYGTVTGDYFFDDELINDKNPDYKNYREVDWQPLDKEIDYIPNEQAPIKSLADITDKTYLVEYFLSKIGVELDSSEEISIEKPKDYTKADFLKNVFLSDDDYNTLVELLEHKQNIILQGPPGVGKTYLAKRLAYSIMGEKDENRVKLVQFHQSYSYEDFIMGLRPREEQGGFKIKTGSFFNFCKKASDDPDPNHKYFFIIDEINRGNLSKIFGELFMLLEKDKHGIQVTPLYREEKITIPTNVYIIGMMNTADRSLAIMDYALRRRFAFFDIYPAFKNKANNRFEGYLKKDERLERLAAVIESINNDISNDPELGDGYLIGHSYLIYDDETLKNLTDKKLENVINYEIVPLLSLYWMDEKKTVEDYKSRLLGAIKKPSND